LFKNQRYTEDINFILLFCKEIQKHSLGSLWYNSLKMLTFVTPSYPSFLDREEVTFIVYARGLWSELVNSKLEQKSQDHYIM
jgi:hypothetical protein